MRWLGRGIRRLSARFSQAVIEAAQGRLHAVGPGQPALELGHAAPAVGCQILLQLGQGRAGEFAGPAGVVAPGVVEPRERAALAIGVKPGLEGGAGTAHRLRDGLQPPFALASQWHGQQALAPRAGRFGVAAAGDEVRRAATIWFCPGSAPAQRRASPRRLTSTSLLAELV